jgi:uncharacterized protein DUF1980
MRLGRGGDTRPGVVMSHNHHHHGGASFREYCTGQLLTIIVVGVFGLIGILMYRNGQLGYLLALQFHRPVVVGGFAILVLVILRAACVWREAARMQDREHAQHNLHHEDPEHDNHGHDLPWTLSRFVVLCFPVGLFLIGVPNSGFSQDRIRKLLGGDDALTGRMATVAYRNGTVERFIDLNEAANDAAKRENLQGQTAILEGQLRWIDARQFTLFRLKMTCCAADTVPLKVRIVLKNGSLSGLSDFTWVQLRGQIQFVLAPNSERYIPVIVVEDLRYIRRTEPKNQYE